MTIAMVKGRFLGVTFALTLTFPITAGCLSQTQTPRQLRGEINETSFEMSVLKSKEREQPKDVEKMYKKFLENRTPLEPLSHYQEVLNRGLSELQDNPDSAQFTRDAVLGFPDAYMRELLSRLQAYQGLARLLLQKDHLPMAEEHASAAIKLIKDRGGPFPYSSSTSLKECYRILEETYEKQRQKGKALVRA